MSRSPMSTVPVTRPMGLVSCMRLMQRTKVLLPQPEGPMRAVAWLADGIGFVHAVDAAHKGAFAAAGRADEGRGMVGRNVQVDVLQRVIGAVPRIQVDDLDANSHLASPFQDAAAGDEAYQREI